ncbi:MAG: dihydrofolate reductase [Gammaproteobacteria bacterium]|nr:dihydrofolate reductase [Gammaproteobacteria bacterium]
MTEHSSRVTLHMAASLDGCITGPDGDVSWMQITDTYANGVAEPDAEQIAEFLAGIDCYVMGSRTYEHALELGWPYGDTPVRVLSRRALPNEKASVEILAGDLEEVINNQLKPRYRNIWLVGGAALTRDCLRQGLVDDIRIVIMPIVLGGGLPFFDEVGATLPLHLKEVTPYRNGLVELWYEVRA